MSQQQTSQSSGQGLLERVFKLREHGTTARTEAIAGFTTFLTMVYIVFVNPQILGVAGMDTSAVFVTTCLIAAFGSILMGLFANLPVALAPAMGLNAFFAFVVVQAMGLPWQVGMGAIFWGAVGLLLLTIFRVRYWMIANIPVSLRVGITSGIGLFIGMMGLKNAGVIVANKDTLVSIGNLTSHSVLLGILGFFIIAILASRNIHAAVLVSIIVTTLLGWILGDVHYTGIVSAPPSITSVIGHVDLAGSFNLGLAGIIFSFMLVNLFDSSGTLIGVTDKAGLADEKGKFPRMKQALFVDSISSVAGFLYRHLFCDRLYRILLRCFRGRAYRSDGGGRGDSVPAGYLPVAAGGHGAGVCRSRCADLCGRTDDIQPVAREVGRPDGSGAGLCDRRDDAVQLLNYRRDCVRLYLLLRDEDWYRSSARSQPVRDYRLAAVRAENRVYRRALSVEHNKKARQRCRAFFYAFTR